MATDRRYASPKAFRRALTDKLKAVAEGSKWTLPQLQRQIAYDRLLERLYLVDQSWVVKGATALLARDLGVRGTIDIDLYRNAAVGVVERELREAVTLDLGDWFVFEVGSGQSVSDGADGMRAATAFKRGAAEAVVSSAPGIGTKALLRFRALIDDATTATPALVGRPKRKVVRRTTPRRTRVRRLTPEGLGSSRRLG